MRLHAKRPSALRRRRSSTRRPARRWALAGAPGILAGIAGTAWALTRRRRGAHPAGDHDAKPPKGKKAKKSG
jgi:hypothetical protein